MLLRRLGFAAIMALSLAVPALAQQAPKVESTPTGTPFIGGVIVEQRVVKTLLNQPQHARTQDFLRRVLRPL